ncbi:MAG TPA: glycosyltransferase family 39 protein, partial [Nitrospiraceae bacterium]|nr:glycosyltransferase family 39 protein [Nitrospiraceae bacterium]
MNFRDQWLPVGAFGGVCAAGLIGAFIGLGVSSFWYDELYTAWVAGTDSSLADVARRATTDVHPPFYYFSIFGFSKIAGTSDEAMRLFSTIWATAAIVLFIAATGRAFSLPARLFGAALATVSNFWFYQAQNARFYSLGFFIATAILAISIVLLKPRDLQEQQARWRIALLFGLMLFASFMHFYLMYLSLAVLIVIALLEPRLRLVMGMFALALITLVFLYLKIVIGTYAQFRIEHSWMGHGFGWYLYQLNAARHLMVNKWALLALAICAGAWLVRLVLR